MASTRFKACIAWGSVLFPLALTALFVTNGLPADIPGFFNIFLALVLFVSFYHSERYGLLLWVASLPLGVVYLYPTLSPLRMSVRLLSYSVATLVFWAVLKRLRSSKQVIAEALARCRAAELRYRSLFEDAPIGYFEADINGVVWEVNSTACRMLGLTRDQVVGRPLWEKIVPDEQAPRRVDALSKLSEGRTLTPFAYTYLSGGESRRIETSEIVIRDVAGNVTGFRCALIDVSERDKLQKHVAQTTTC
jgi:PAS domain S-box-containing protein